MQGSENVLLEDCHYSYPFVVSFVRQQLALKSKALNKLSWYFPHFKVLLRILILIFLSLK